MMIIYIMYHVEYPGSCCVIKALEIEPYTSMFMVMVL